MITGQFFSLNRLLKYVALNLIDFNYTAYFEILICFCQFKNNWFFLIFLYIIKNLNVELIWN